MSRTPERGVARRGTRAIHSGITTLEPHATGAMMDLATSAQKPFTPEAAPVGRTASEFRRESDPAVMLGFVTLAVACMLLTAVVAFLWLLV